MALLFYRLRGTLSVWTENHSRFCSPLRKWLVSSFPELLTVQPKGGQRLQLGEENLWYWSWRQLGIFCVELDFLNTKSHQELKPCWGRWVTVPLMEQVRLGGGGDPELAITIAFANVNFSRIKLIKSYLKVKINHVTRIFSELYPQKKKKKLN